MIYDKIAAGRGSPRTPLGELMTLPQTLKLDPWRLANVALTPYDSSSCIAVPKLWSL